MAYKVKPANRDRRYATDRACRKYGITVGMYHMMLIKQQGLCRICNGPPIGKIRLSVDHDHKTGKVRGLLCDKCNQAIGAFNENTSIMQQAIDYLNRATLYHG